jgi:hypothetical protein
MFFRVNNEYVLARVFLVLFFALCWFEEAFGELGIPKAARKIILKMENPNNNPRKIPVHIRINKNLSILNIKFERKGNKK